MCFIVCIPEKCFMKRLYFVILQYQSVLKSSPRTFLSQFKFHADIDFNTAYKNKVWHLTENNVN